MSYYLVKFEKQKNGKGAPEKMMIECASPTLVRECADTAAQKAGGGKAALQLFNEIGLVATRTPEGVWRS